MVLQRLQQTTAPAATMLIRCKLPALQASGFWKMEHEARTEFSMVLGCLLLLWAAAGSTSADAWARNRFKGGGHGTQGV